MKKLCIIIFCIILISGCKSFYNFTFENNNISEQNSRISFWAIQSLCFENSINNNGIKKIEYIDGWIKIGKETITFKKNEINISIFMKGNPNYSRISIEHNGENVISEKEKQEYLKYIDKIMFFKYLDYRTQKKIFKQNNEIVEAYFEYNIILENDIIHYIINEEFVLSAEKQLKFFAYIEYILGHI
jgi:hypothetical protein